MTRLIAGERLSRAEFERRWDLDPDTKHAELLEGVVHTGVDGRWEPACRRTDLSYFTGMYRVDIPQVSAGIHSSVRVDAENELQPTSVMYSSWRRGGRPITDLDGVLSSPPDLAADVVTAHDRDPIPFRRRIHERFGTREYLCWDVERDRIEWLVLREGRFEPLVPDSDGLLKSVAFPGLWLDPVALIRRDLAAVLAALNRGLASPEHAAFVQRLRPPG